MLSGKDLQLRGAVFNASCFNGNVPDKIILRSCELINFCRYVTHVSLNTYYSFIFSHVSLAIVRGSGSSIFKQGSMASWDRAFGCYPNGC